MRCGDDGMPTWVMPQADKVVQVARKWPAFLCASERVEGLDLHDAFPLAAAGTGSSAAARSVHPGSTIGSGTASSNVLVLERGGAVETGRCEEVFLAPRHPDTRGQNLRLRRRVEPGDDFVRHHQSGFERNGARDADALPLTAADPRRCRLQRRGEEQDTHVSCALQPLQRCPQIRLYCFFIKHPPISSRTFRAEWPS